MNKKFIKEDMEYLVSVSLTSYSFADRNKFRVSINMRQKGKKKWLNFIDEDDYKYRALSMEAREERRMSKIISDIPKEWIEYVKRMEITRISMLDYEY